MIEDTNGKNRASTKGTKTSSSKSTAERNHTDVLELKPQNFACLFVCLFAILFLSSLSCPAQKERAKMTKSEVAANCIPMSSVRGQLLPPELTSFLKATPSLHVFVSLFKKQK